MQLESIGKGRFETHLKVNRPCSFYRYTIFKMMQKSRRSFIEKSALGAMLLGGGLSACASEGEKDKPDLKERFNQLDKVADAPVLRRELFNDPMIIESVELLRFEDSFLCRVRTVDGAEGISVSNSMQMASLYPIFVRRLQPFFIGKDARDFELLISEVYVYRSNYKLQNLALWVPLATIEFAVLDLLGKHVGKPIGALIGNIHHQKIAVYRANNYRGKSAEESIDLIRRNVEETSAKALKFKVGGRMGNMEEPAGRSEALIPLVRRTFGDEMVIYADANGSYNQQEAIHLGRLMEEHGFDFYEEPVPFDWYEETLAVSEALGVPIAGGEQEPSLRRFRWLIAHNALQIVQPDIFYFGGMIRSMKVARMAEVLGTPCVPHISGSGLGYVYMMHFVSVLPNAGPYHEFKGFNKNLPFDCPTSTLQSANGEVVVPSGPGLGITIDPDYVDRHTRVADQ
jgi:L-alanine-DL-glutamate epimerase-like enolase superfamily enzyme